MRAFSALIFTLLHTRLCHSWLGFLGKLKLHWLLSTAVDQFLFSPFFNILIFWSFALLSGGVGFSVPTLAALADPAEPLTASVSLHRNNFPPLSEYAPVWSTQVTAYKIWIPAVLAREALVPPHLAAVYCNVVGFVWNIIFAAIMNGS